MKASAMISSLILCFALSASTLAQAPPSSQATLTEIWRTDAVLSTCESVLFDEDRNLLFVSCINGQPMEKNGLGFIALLKPDGSMKELEWVTGLNAPKGMGVVDGKLYVADIDELVVINVEKARISDRIKVDGASFLNDVAIGKDGTIYFTDSDTGLVWTYKDGKLQKWLQGLERPNGLYIEEDRVLLTTSGSQDLRVIDRATGKMKVVTQGIGHGDGVEFTGQEGYYITSSWSGEVFLIQPDFSKVSLLKTSDQEINSADIGFNRTEQVVYVPTFFDNRVVAYRLKIK